MTGEPADGGQETTSPDGLETDLYRRFSAAFNNIVGRVDYPGVAQWAVIRYLCTPEGVALATAAAIFSKAFLDTLGKRAADGLADLVHTRLGRRGKTDIYLVGVLDGTAAATIIVTADLPDEARLALLDLDVTAEDVRGKTLRWDNDTTAWLTVTAHED